MKYLKSKTIDLALVVGLFGALQVNLPMLQESISPELYGYITFGLAIAIAVARALTTKPLSEK